MKVVFAYIPVIHKHALEFFNTHKDSQIWLLNNEIAKKDNPYLERDARALAATDIQRELECHGFQDIKVVAPADLATQAKGVEVFIVPEDEVILDLLEKYVPNVQTEKHNIFIRWTQKLSTTEFEVSVDREVTEADFAQTIMTDLEKEAAKSPDWWRQIASAIVKDGNIIATAHNKHYPSSHALEINGDPRSNLNAGEGPGIYTSIHSEAAVIAECARKGISTEGADLYVTTFPCPTCARSLVEAGFKKIFYKKGYSLLDAEEILKNAGIEIVLVQD